MRGVSGVTGNGYNYNGKGERVRKTHNASGAATLYHYGESGNLLFESDGGNRITTEYIWLGNQRIALVNNAAAGGGALYYIHTDHLGAVQLLTDNTGAIAWQGDYKPFGEVSIITANVTNNLRLPKTKGSDSMKTKGSDSIEKALKAD